MNKQEKIIFAVLIAVIICLVSWLSFLHIRQKYYEIGFTDGRTAIYNAILTDLHSRGYTTIYEIQNNQTKVYVLEVVE